ncbi:Probable BOI-related E3 ubiquitin-protein ligase 3, partial [Linum grandiflorum]
YTKRALTPFLSFLFLCVLFTFYHLFHGTLSYCQASFFLLFISFLFFAMAVQAQLYPDTFLFPMCASQDFMPPTPNFSDDHHQQHLLCFGFHDSQPHLSLLSSQTAEAHLHIQRQELDAILQVQKERLRMALQEQRKQQIGVLLKGMEVRATSLLRRKHDDLSLAARNKAELEASLRRAEAENDKWRRLAMEKEAVVVDLNRQLELLNDRMGAADDAESSAGVEWVAEEKGNGVGGCKRCGIGEACVVFLPCMHVCSCKDCELFLAICPVCTSLKESTLDVYFSGEDQG